MTTHDARTPDPPAARQPVPGTLRSAPHPGTGHALLPQRRRAGPQLAVRLSFQDSDAYQQGRAWWRSECRIRAAAARCVGTGHAPDAKASWPDLPVGQYGGQCWVIGPS